MKNILYQCNYFMSLFIIGFFLEKDTQYLVLLRSINIFTQLIKFYGYKYYLTEN
jgi:cellulose synthase/poly-beta-1,6-N-acetylglucosamine synthase-like glycosyltransferase